MSELREGIFRLQTRRFGNVAEILVKKLLKALDSTDNSYDIKDGDVKIECKFSRALSESKIKVTDTTVLQAIYHESNRDIAYEGCENFKWDCNFQQIKKDLFDVLFYGIFFSDYLVIYKIPSGEIDENIKYCNKQHRGNTGEGQFHITNSNIELHSKYLYSLLSYEDIEKCLKLH